MRSFLRLTPFRALSFDLDDTLYNNKPIIAAAEVELLQWLAQHFPATTQYSQDDWRQLKIRVLAAQPQLVHDTSATRRAVLYLGLKTLGYQDAIAVKGADDGLSYFYDRRSNFRVSVEVISLLTQLSQRWPIVGITNGNVNEQAIGLGGVMSFVLHPGNGVRMKPFADMFVKAAERLALLPSQLLHVGDHPMTDVAGARRAGCQAIWLNPGFGQVAVKSSGPLLPQLQVSELAQLKQLL
ncbi:HAD-IA family hydrolase [Shewanella fodinae]|uniref:Putative hydrolase of the HAD superfamily n=1 Tax=Shewanella fodinae TaxID=552357 RepID=A0A4R2FIK7_9GAMM|nr:HAD-IA family hydrolase [Shewanella fodinae]TCN90721.1 putative hydrolase of the HAD superfamily [Shewanella fodinae]